MADFIQPTEGLDTSLGNVNMLESNQEPKLRKQVPQATQCMLQGSISFSNKVAFVTSFQKICR